jgi:acetoin utilization deacetylase AcuC-like enzyme
MSAPRRATVLWHADALLHETGEGVFEHPPSPLIEVPELHPENEVRVRNIRSALGNGPIAAHLDWRDGRHATAEELAWLHDPAYVAEVARFAASGGGLLSGATVVGPGSWPAALAAAGTAIEATRAVLDGDAGVAYALVRPPGHHAMPAATDGYCLFNNTGLAAEAAVRAGVERVAVIDWDVHHGNGTQECFYRRPDVLTISLHMPHGPWSDAHRQTGSRLEAGLGAGTGFNVNVEMPFGSGDAAYTAAMQRVVAPLLELHRPGLIVVACGQDANQFDPNGRQLLSMAGFRRLGELVAGLADAHCGGRLVLVQEGGYARSYSALCMHATLEGVLGTGELLADPMGYLPERPDLADAELAAVRGALARYWAL